MNSIELTRRLQTLIIGIVALWSTWPAFVLAQQPAVGFDLAILPDVTIATNVAQADSDTTTPGRPAVGFDGTNYLVVSCRSVGSPIGLFGVIVSAQGAVLSQFQITGQSGQFSSPSVSFDGSNYLIVFQQGGLIYGVRVSPLGQVLDPPNGFQISSGIPFQITNFGPDLAFDGQNFFVVWNKFTNSNYEIFGARVSPLGQVLSEFPVFTAPGEQVFASVTFGAGNYFVVWRDTRSGSGPSPGTDIFGTRVSPPGAILDPAGIAICTATNLQGAPHVAFDGHNYFVVWLDQRHHDPISYVLDIYGARVAPSGALLDGPSSTGGIAINTSSTEYKADPRVCFDGRDFFVTWWLSTFSPPAGAFAARVSTNGVVLDGPVDGLGVQIRAPNCFACRVVHPNPVFNNRGVLVAWVNNTELSGTYKDVFANLVVAKPRIIKLDVNAAGGGDVRITFETRRNQRYQLETSNDLTAWQIIGTQVLGTGEPVEVTFSGAAIPGCGYFRVEVQY